MARYKHIDTGPRFIAVDLERLLLPGSFEYALNYLVDRQLDLSRFDICYLPRGACMKRLTQKQCDWIAHELNTRPRKRHGYKTPLEVYHAS